MNWITTLFVSLQLSIAAGTAPTIAPDPFESGQIGGGWRAKRIIWDNRMEPARYRETVRKTAAAPGGATEGLLINPPWESIGPLYIDKNDSARHAAGRVRDIQFWDQEGVATNPVIGASSGGIYRLYIAGLFPLWIPLGENLDCPSVGGFAVHPLDSDTMIVGTGDQNRVGGCGMFKTTDAGATWQPLDTPGTPAWTKKVLYADAAGNEVWAAGDSGILKSTDAGETWVRELAGDAHDLVQHPSQPQTIYAALNSFGIYRTDNGGVTWDPVNTGLPPSSKRDIVLLAIAESSPNELWTAIYDGDDGLLGVYKTINGGGSWLWRGPLRGTDLDTPQEAVDPVGQGWHALALAVSPINPDLVYVGASRTVVTTTGANDATEWARVDIGHADYTRFAFDPGDPNRMWVANDGGIYTHDVNTQVTTSQTLWGLPITQSYALDLPETDLQKVVSGTQDNGAVFRQRGDSPVWDFGGGGDGFDVAYASQDENRVYATLGLGFSRLTSTDNGDNWTDIDQGLSIPWAPTLQIDKAIGGGAVVITHDADQETPGDSAKVHYSTDFGASWTPFDAPWGAGPSIRRARMNWSGTYGIYVYFWNDARVFVGTGNSLGAIDFQDRSIPGVSRLMAIQTDRYRSAVAYAFEQSPQKRVFRTTNFGAPWVDITGNLPSGLQVSGMVSHPDNPDHLFAATAIGAFRSGNGGATWSPFMDGMPRSSQITDMRFMSDATGDYLHIATFGHGFWRRPIGEDLGSLLLEHGFEGGTFAGWSAVVGD